MTSSPDLIQELRTTRPAAPAALRARVRQLATVERQPRAQRAGGFLAGLRLPARRAVLVVVPAAAALALVSAGTLGIVRSGGSTEAFERQTAPGLTSQSGPTTELAVPQGATDSTGAPSTPGTAATGKSLDRAERVSATLTVEVPDSGAVGDAAQDVLTLTRSLGGYVVSSNVVTGDEGSAAIVVRVPSDRVQQAIVELSTIGRIVSQQVTIEDLQEELDAMQRRANSLRQQIARITARLESETLDAETRAVLEARRRALRAELRQLRGGIAASQAEARMATIQLAVVTPGQTGAVVPPSRLDRTLDEALSVLLWEGVIALAIAIVLAPFALVALAVWLGHRLYRRREEERLLAAH
jgi:hypothetical protein